MDNKKRASDILSLSIRKCINYIDRGYNIDIACEVLRGRILNLLMTGLLVKKDLLELFSNEMPQLRNILYLFLDSQDFEDIPHIMDLTVLDVLEKNQDFYLNSNYDMVFPFGNSNLLDLQIISPILSKSLYPYQNGQLPTRSKN